MKKNLEIHIGVSLRGNMKTIEIIIGKEKLEEYYNADANNIGNFIKSELSEYLTQEKIEQLENSIIKEGSIEYYKKDEKSQEISSRSVVEELCSNVKEKRKNQQVDLAEALSSYVVLEVDDSRNYESFENLYNVSKFMLKEMEIIIGRENIQEYYNNGKLEDLRKLITQNLSKEEYKKLQTGENSHELLMKLCRNMGQENLADVLENINKIEPGCGEELDLFYRENELLCSYDNNGLSLSKYSIDREQLLQMDYASFRKFLGERAVEQEKKNEEIRF